MPIISNANPLAAEGHKAFDIELVLGQHFNAFGFENDDFTTLGPPKIIAHAVDEQMVAGEDLEFEDIFTFLKFLSITHASTSEEVVRRKPNRKWRITDHETL